MLVNIIHYLGQLSARESRGEQQLYRGKCIRYAYIVCFDIIVPFLLCYIELQVFCGDKKARGRYSIVTVPSRAALAEYNSVNSAPPGDAAKFALRLLGVFFTSEELARSNCTKAEGRELLDPEILQAIKRERVYLLPGGHAVL